LFAVHKDDLLVPFKKGLFYSSVNNNVEINVVFINKIPFVMMFSHNIQFWYCSIDKSDEEINEYVCSTSSTIVQEQRIQSLY